MKIGIDARLLSYRRGIGTFVYNMLSHLTILDRKNQYFLYVDKKSKDSDLALPENSIIRPHALPSYPLWEQVCLPLAAMHDDVDILHCPANTGPLFLPQQIKRVLTIHDVMYLLPYEVLPPSPSLYQRLGRIYRRWVVPRIAKRADAIITDSHHSRQDIFSLLQLPSEHVFVIYGAPGHAFRPLPNKEMVEKVKQRYRVQSQFILTLGGLDPRKNTTRVLQAFKKFEGRAKSDYQLVIVGLPRNGQKLFSHTAMEIGITEEVVLAGFVPEEDLVALYNGADVFLYPSLYEGFGLPVLEAMACGTPVIASTAGSIPEIAEEAALLIGPNGVEALVLAIEQVVTDQALRQELTARGFEHVKKFSWEKAAKELLAVYEKLMQV
jgi:glycosyltransferase involved in cell wall biosynthesis